MLDRILVETLNHIQSRDNLTNEQFAQKIGIHEVSWSRIRNFKKGFGEKSLTGIRQAYPELKEAITTNSFTAISFTANSPNSFDLKHYARPQRHPEPISGGLKGKVGGFLLRLIKGA